MIDNLRSDFSMENLVTLDIVLQSLDPEEFPDTNQDPNDEIEDLIDELAESMSDSGQEMDQDTVSVISTPKPRLR
jgi:hypothetical protein